MSQWYFPEDTSDCILALMAYKQISPADSQQIINALSKVEKILLETLDYDTVIQRVVDSILYELDYMDIGYRIFVLGLVDEKREILERVSISQTEEARQAVSGLPMPFGEANVPLSAKDNFCIKVMDQKEPLITHDWQDILTPPLTPEDARSLQQQVGIKTSMVYPLIVRDKSIGMMIFSVVKEENEISEQEKWLLTRFTDIVALTVQNAKLYSNLSLTTKHLDEANKHLTELDKMKDEFLSLASHELRTPMTAIKGYVWMVQNGKAGPITDTTKNYLDIVYKSTERLIHLVNDMLDISRIESGKTQLHSEPAQFSDLFSQIQTEFSAYSQTKKIAMEFSPLPTLPAITLDKDKILQVLENLVGNAFKFTPEGGKITLSARPVSDTIEVSVSDTGKGMAPEDLPRLFTKFSRLGGDHLTTYSQPGTGLGLYLSKQYVEMHHGQIWAVSELGKGSTFTFSLPVDKITTS